MDNIMQISAQASLLFQAEARPYVTTKFARLYLCASASRMVTRPVFSVRLLLAKPSAPAGQA
jgi:hypothetical protein